ncbi:thymidine phosphorylase [Candidatus Micrarchaeota archaeon]|nr:thymidine phosphorylase [Candidatus Micrarchaeota archaeon]
MDLRFKVIVYDIEQGQNEVILNESQAQELDFALHDRLLLKAKGKKAVAIVDYSHKAVPKGGVGVFWEVALALGIKTGDSITLQSCPRPASLEAVRKKLDGKALEPSEVQSIIADLMAQRLSTGELAAFIAGVHTRGMNVDETIALTDAIIASGERLKFSKDGPVISEHSIGGVAADRTSMLFVPIMASMGFRVPKTCSRAISSAAGTADVMELFSGVAFPAKKMKAIVDNVGGCLVWGGAVNMAAADDKLIQIRHPLHLDPKPLLLSSILAKKKAEGAQFVLLDIPTGQGAKVLDLEEARLLAKDFTALGAHLGLTVDVSITDGSEPLMPVVGPVLEARAVLETLQGRGSSALAEKACRLCGISLSMVRKVSFDEGYRLAKQRLDGGHALKKFLEIVHAQDGNPKIKTDDLVPGEHHHTMDAKEGGRIRHVDNKNLSRVVRALGAPEDHYAGLKLFAMKGEHVEKGHPLVELYATSKEKLAYGIETLKAHNPVEIENIVLDVV